MGSLSKTGIYFYFSSNNSSTNLHEVINYLNKIPGLKITSSIDISAYSKNDKLVNEIREKGLEKIIIAGDSPGMIKNMFSSAMAKSGNNPDNIILLNFNEYGLLANPDKDKAVSVLLGALYDIPYEKLVANGQLPVNHDTLVIGGGIAGIQSSLEIANANKKVYLLEKSGTIGGHMAMFDKTFPTLDCAACILTPKMVEVGQHPNIEMITYANVTGVSGLPGNYKVKILKKARKVNQSLCIGCGSCSARCPGETRSEFDSGISLRKAIYIPFPQAVPNKYLVDAENCRYINDPFEITAQTIKELRKNEGFPKDLLDKLAKLKKQKIRGEDDFISKLNNTIGVDNSKKYKDLIYQHSGQCKNCIRFCPVNDCINLDEQDKEIEITVGNIIIATGFKPFEAERAEQFGYGKYPNVLTSLELERLINAAGPTEGKITLRSEDKKGNPVFLKDGVIPKSVALIHCVGSRDKNHNKYCSKVCCMYSLKLAHLVKEKIPDAEVSEYFIDMRAFGKGYEEFYQRIKNEGVNIIRGRTAKVKQLNGQLEIRGENIIEDSLIEQKVDMVVLAVGLEPGGDNEILSQMMGVSLTEDGWFKEADSNSNPTGTNVAGISIAGVCQGPKDIPDTVAQASAAAAGVLQSIVKGEIKNDSKEISLEIIEETIKKLV
ncbi:MAG: CoB--CoM heterodisulfide reductase iron-sulfur subunit A family protein [Bacteroidota bacterium]